MKVDMDGFDAAFKEAQEKSRAGGKKTGGPQLLFEAEATAWLANNAVPPPTMHSQVRRRRNPPRRVKAILTLDGFKESTESRRARLGSSSIAPPSTPNPADRWRTSARSSARGRLATVTDVKIGCRLRDAQSAEAWRASWRLETRARRSWTTNAAPTSPRTTP